MFSNELSEAQIERLAILIEECGEAIQAAGKILRHGYESYNPDNVNSLTNRRELEKELGDVMYAIDALAVTRDINGKGVEDQTLNKVMKITRYLHHQK